MTEDLNKWKEILVPVVKQPAPQMLEELVSIQPMTENAGQVFKMREGVPHKWIPGTIFHSFIKGWRIACDDEGNDIDLFSEEAKEIMEKYPHEHHEHFKKRWKNWP